MLNQGWSNVYDVGPGTELMLVQCWDNVDDVEATLALYVSLP